MPRPVGGGTLPCRCMDEIPAGAVERVLQEARVAAGGDARGMLAVVQAAYLEQAIRIAISEQPSDRQLAAIHAFSSVAGRRILDAATQYGSPNGANDERRAVCLGRVHNAQEEATRFAQLLRNRLETIELTRTPSDRNWMSRTRSFSPVRRISSVTSGFLEAVAVRLGAGSVIGA